MEDRLTPALYLELSPSTPAEYERARVPELAAAPGVGRVWWWANAHPNRTDLPRRVEEGTVLGLAEMAGAELGGGAGGAGGAGGRAAGSLVAPAGSAGFHFRRTPRPGQGVLTGRPTVGLLLVLISARDPADAQALRDWADFVHIRHIAAAAVPGYAMITPYERDEPAEVVGPRYLHLYEIDDGEPEEVFQSMVPLVISRIGPPGSPAFDAWARHPALRIEYVNTFRLVGSTAGRG